MSQRDLNVFRVSQPAGSRDRHSKVFTSKGLRDRRMRLSIQTAIKLYDLQDRLGLDRPSQTVEWLLQKAQAAIHDLSQTSSDANLFQPASLSSTNPKNSRVEGTASLKKAFTSWKSNRESSSSRYSAALVSRLERRENAIINPIVRKETRTKARERARERTRFKCSTKQNLKLFPQQPLSENMLLQGSLDSSPSLSYPHNQKTFQLSSSQEGVSSIQSNVGTSSKHSTRLPPTRFQQGLPYTTGFSMQDHLNFSDFSSEGQFFSNQELLHDLQDLDTEDICVRSFVEPPQAYGITFSNTCAISSYPSSPYPHSYTLLDNVIDAPACKVVMDSQ